ncbi:MAG: preprotein translocase subunit SecA [Elusimicrobia bacterium]|nr:preprotein translocase subunit SecA [Elusimicrobiota bacterium]
MRFIINKIFGTPSARSVRKLGPLVSRVNELEDSMKALSDEQLTAKRREFMDRHKNGETLSQLMPEAFAVVREACRRSIGLRHFDVQLVGGAVLFEGQIAEMTTGEGKTLVAVLPVYLQSIAGTHVHVVTVNDYLARRDSEWMGPAYRALGLKVGYILSDMMPEERKTAYDADVVYITNNELGFDYLRDNMAISPSHRVQSDLEFAIIDEVDSVLIDEARTPLIISGPAGKSSDKYFRVDRIIPALKIKFITEEEAVKEKYKFEESGKKGDYRDEIERGSDAIIDEKHKNVHLTEEGMKKCEALLDSKLFDDITGEWVHHINQALRAHYLFKKDVDYVVKDGQVIIVDEFTGRLMPGRRWSDGLHQAVEAKENIKIKRENQTLATITFQNFFNLYKKLAGMTGTALTEQAEFFKIYKLPVVEIPTNRDLRRQEMPDAIYRTEREKFSAVVDTIIQLNKKGSPVLVGTRSIEVSERLSLLLKRRGVKHSVLNAKYHLKEAEIIAQAGRKSAVTISTNMAGRGTDIVLGGNPEYLAKEEMKRREWDHELILKASEKSPASGEEEEKAKAEFSRLYESFKKETDREHEDVVGVGGLHVIGTERHESRRIDNQLRGRAGRQGDPGSSKFFVSLEDELMRLFGGERIMGIMDRIGGMEEGEKIEHPLINTAIGNAQKRVEAMNFDIRKQLLEYDNVMDKQRRSIYSHRSRILKGEDVEEEVLGFIEDYVDIALEELVPLKQHSEEWDVKALSGQLMSYLGLNIAIDPGEFYHSGREGLRSYLEDSIKDAYGQRKKKLGETEFSNMERMILLQIIDSRWKDHLYELDHLKEGISYRAYGQKDPLIEYKRESFFAFATLMDSIKKEVIIYLFRASGEILKSQLPGYRGEKIKPRAELPRAGGQEMTAAAGGAAQPLKVKQRKVTDKTGRNDPCPCGSGRKYKHCCGR